MTPQRENITYDLSLLAISAAKWKAASGLRAVYQDIFLAMRLHAVDGPALELGAGIGAMREFVPGLVASDVVRTEYVDLAVSAYEIEQTERTWSTLYAFDVLHHLCQPLRFFASAASSLRPGGRVVLMEPAATLGARLFYTMFHVEPTRPSRLHAPYVFEPDDDRGNFANMGMGWVLFVRDRKLVDERLAELGLKVREVQFRDGLAYAATGGFSGRQLLPTTVLRALLRIERVLPQWFWRFCALRMLIVLEKI